MVSGPVAEHLFSNQTEQARLLMESQLEEAEVAGDEPPKGEVYLVGTGPGDPDLLTFRALRLMQQTDVVLYDRLIGDGILNLVRRDAERIYVGKLKDNHTVPQEEIGNMLIRLAQEGKRVLRLKGARLILNPTYGFWNDLNEAMIRTRSFENELYFAFTHPRQGLVTNTKGKIVAKEEGPDDG